MAETLPLSHSAGVTGSWRDTLFVWCGKISTEATKNDDDDDDKTKDGKKMATKQILLGQAAGLVLIQLQQIHRQKLKGLHPKIRLQSKEINFQGPTVLH